MTVAERDWLDLLWRETLMLAKLERYLCEHSLGRQREAEKKK